MHSDTPETDEQSQPAPFATNGAAEAVVDIPTQSPEARIQELEFKLRDTELRAAAEMQNYQARVSRDADNVKRYAIEKFASSLLEVVDNLERAVQSADSAPNPLLDGVKLTHKSLLDILARNGIEVVDPQSAAFNADLHQAVGMDPNTPTGQVANVLQRGYTLNGRLLRPAMVTVGQ